MWSWPGSTYQSWTTEVPWGVTNSLKRVGLLRRTQLPAPMSSMASTSAVSKVTKGSIWSRLEATKTALKFSAPHLYSKKGWEMATEHATWFACINMPNQTLDADHTQDKLTTCNKADQPPLWRLACVAPTPSTIRTEIKRPKKKLYLRQINGRK